MGNRSWSRAWFRKRFHEDIYDYEPNRFLSIVRDYFAGIQGLVYDAGCGFMNPYLAKIRLSHTVGVDIDPRVKLHNPLHKTFLIQDLHSFKPGEKAQAILSVYTWEHLKRPEIVLDNFANALTEGGLVGIIASQKWHYVSVLGRLLPKQGKNIAWKWLKGRNQMPYPAYWRLCSKTSLSKAARLRGFEVIRFQAIESPPLWFATIPPLFMMASYWMKSVNKISLFEGIRGTFIAVLRKKSNA